MDSSDSVTAAVLVIGDEILSGRTKDKNIGFLAEYLTNLAIELREVRIVPDDEARIVEAVNALRPAYTYLFTTGGIGPTHDDITADSVAKAFGVGISENETALAMLQERYASFELNEGRRRMARAPDGASLIDNPVSKAPGFQLGNVFVMAGVPSIMQAMMDNVAPRLRSGTPFHVVNIATDIKEGDAAGPLRTVQDAHVGVAIGSYPYYSDAGFGTNVVCRGKDGALVDEAAAAVVAALQAAGARTELTRPE